VSWSVPVLWPGETCFILGGGASLTPAAVERIAGHGRVIAVNNAYQIAPPADCLYFADRQWLAWHHEAVARHAAPLKVTRAEPGFAHGVESLKVVEHHATAALSDDRTRLAGLDSGANAINLAVFLGATRIVLLGFDMRPGHWHADHPHATPDHVYATHYLPHYARLAVALTAFGIDVVNATPGSALTHFPHRTLGQLIP